MEVTRVGRARRSTSSARTMAGEAPSVIYTARSPSSIETVDLSFIVEVAYKSSEMIGCWYKCWSFLGYTTYPQASGMRKLL